MRGLPKLAIDALRYRFLRRSESRMEVEEEVIVALMWADISAKGFDEAKFDARVDQAMHEVAALKAGEDIHRAATVVNAALEGTSPASEPLQLTCARCGKKGTSEEFYPEEGDEWECPECWERCEAQERREAAAIEELPVLGAGGGPRPLPEVFRTVYVFGVQRPHDKEPWFLAFEDQVAANAYPHRCTETTAVLTYATAKAALHP